MKPLAQEPGVVDPLPVSGRMQLDSVCAPHGEFGTGPSFPNAEAMLHVLVVLSQVPPVDKQNAGVERVVPKYLLIWLPSLLFSKKSMKFC